MPITELTEDSKFVDLLTDAGANLVCVDFFATWCGPCIAIAPFLKQLSTKYPLVHFLKVDVDKCPGTAAAYNVSAMPTFVFFRARTEIDRMRGADKANLENKIKTHIEASASAAAGESGGEITAAPKGAYGDFIDLVSMIDKKQSECLNESDDHNWSDCLNESEAAFLDSDVDEQILLHITFTQAVKLHSIIFQGPAKNGPKQVKLFINQTRTLDFDSAEQSTPIQEFDLKPEDLKDMTQTKLRFVKFQNVNNITLFFNQNQSGSDVTRLTHLKFIGAPLSVTNMSEFKRVSGQAGEAHG